MSRKHIFLSVAALLLLALAALPASAQTYVTYVTQEGDSLSKIAAQFCTSWQAIYQINYEAIGSDPNIIVPGVALTIPAYCNNPSPPPTSSGVYDRGPQYYATGYTQGSYYVVAWGDTLTGISQRFGVDVNTLISANGLNEYGDIYAGQSLYIPGLTSDTASTPPPPVYYPTPVPPTGSYDADGDGVPDYQDICPYEYGYWQYSGCPYKAPAPPTSQPTPVPPEPDSDGDGRPDSQDACPTKWGYPEYQGCLVPT